MKPAGPYVSFLQLRDFSSLQANLSSFVDDFEESATPKADGHIVEERMEVETDLLVRSPIPGGQGGSVKEPQNALTAWEKMYGEVIASV